ncbi:MAG: GatB/YqeY domain-containing protein [Patescibacteria group bacterium]
MSLLKKLNEDLIVAVKAKDDVVTTTLRFLLSAIHNAQIAKGSELTDEEVVREIAKSAGRRRESIEAFEKAGRTDLVEKETTELAVLAQYLPQPLTEAEIENMVNEAIEAVGAKTVADLGKVVKAVLGSAGFRVEGARVAQVARAKLSG